MAADTILCNGRIVTLVPDLPYCSAIAIAGGKIARLGSYDDVRSLQRSNTHVINLRGHTVIPGLIDSHAHIEREGLKTRRPSLSGVKSVGGVLDRIAAVAARSRAGNWIVTMPIGEPPHYFGGITVLREGRAPTRFELDRAAPENPVCIMGVFGHWGEPPGYWVFNSLALERLKIHSDTRPTIPGIEIERDAQTGALTGLVIEHHSRHLSTLDVLKGVPSFSLDARVEGLRGSLSTYHSVGVTSVYEGHGSAPESIAAFRHLWEAGELTVRSRLVVSPTWLDLKEAGRDIAQHLAFARGRGLGDDWLSVSGVFIGYLGDTRIRRLALDALPDTGWSGFVEPASTEAEYAELIRMAARNDLRVHTVALGRLDPVLTALESIDAEYPLPGRRWVLEHLDIVRPIDIKRMRRLGIVVTTIPATMLWLDGCHYRAKAAHDDELLPLRAMLDGGLNVAAGTDNVPVNPFATMGAMIARQDRRTGQVWGRREALGFEQSLRTFTVEGAHLSFEEHVKGTLEPGKLADLAVLSEVPFGMPPETLGTIRSVLTIVGGRIVHDEGAVK